MERAGLNIGDKNKFNFTKGWEVEIKFIKRLNKFKYSTLIKRDSIFVL